VRSLLTAVASRNACSSRTATADRFIPKF
jgi:hypothetical protein